MLCAKLCSEAKYFSPQEIKLVHDGGKSNIFSKRDFWENLFKLVNQDSMLTCLGTPLVTLDNVLDILWEYKSLTTEITFEINSLIDYVELDKILMRINVFKQEADKFQIFPRVKVSFLTRVWQNSKPRLKYFKLLKKYLQDAGLICVPLFYFKKSEDFSGLKKVAQQLSEDKEPLLVYAETLTPGLMEIMLQAQNIFTFHNVLNRRFYGSVSSPLGTKCWAAKKRLFIQSNGWVYPCYGAFLFRRKIGDLRKMSLEQIISVKKLPINLNGQFNRKNPINFDSCPFIPQVAREAVARKAVETKTEPLRRDFVNANDEVRKI